MEHNLPIKGNPKYEMLTILGPTATRKTGIAAKLALELGGEIISADSRQVYKYMDIGTGKDLNEYKIDDVLIPYHLIDIAEPTEEYNIFRFKTDFNRALKKIKQNEHLPILVGGTGLYLSVILQNYLLQKADFSEKRQEELGNKTVEQLKKILLDLKPVQHNTTDLINKNRIIRAIQIEESIKIKSVKDSQSISSLNIGINPGREEIKKRITHRLQKRLDEGMIDEVKNLLDKGVSHEKLNFFGLEYKFLSLYLRGELNYNDMYQKLNSAIHKFAKRQMTWFRKMEKEGVIINWFDGSDYKQILNFVNQNISDYAGSAG
ncbi:MAG: tRNA (adenosine(37)-N6)-dimethylallyltransferase MiaA [Ignavibacteria bacterium]|jgi:tRNA dimethylallyltransferase